MYHIRNVAWLILIVFGLFFHTLFVGVLSLVTVGLIAIEELYNYVMGWRHV